MMISEILAFCPLMKTFRHRRSALICRFITSANFEIFDAVKFLKSGYREQWVYGAKRDLGAVTFRKT